MHRTPYRRTIKGKKEAPDVPGIRGAVSRKTDHRGGGERNGLDPDDRGKGREISRLVS